MNDYQTHTYTGDCCALPEHNRHHTPPPPSEHEVWLACLSAGYAAMALTAAGEGPDEAFLVLERDPLACAVLNAARTAIWFLMHDQPDQVRTGLVEVLREAAAEAALTIGETA